VPRQVGQIQRDEPLARFIFSRRHFSPTKKVVKAPAFIPNPDDLQTSVFRIYELGEQQIRDIGEGVGRIQSPPRSPRARGEIEVNAVLNVGVNVGVGLHVIPDEPPPRHAEITGWPRDDKPQQLEIAKLLAAAALLVLHD
jgi:hypothetical protein